MANMERKKGRERAPGPHCLYHLSPTLPDHGDILNPAPKQRNSTGDCVRITWRNSLCEPLLPLPRLLWTTAAWIISSSEFTVPCRVSIGIWGEQKWVDLLAPALNHQSEYLSVIGSGLQHFSKPPHTILKHSSVENNLHGGLQLPRPPMSSLSTLDALCALSCLKSQCRRFQSFVVAFQSSASPQLRQICSQQLWPNPSRFHTWRWRCPC